jgi:hypothetical protein
MRGPLDGLGGDHLRRFNGAIVVYTLLLTLSVALPTNPPPIWIVGLGGLLIAGVIPLSLSILVVVIRQWPTLRWHALTPLLTFALGLGVAWFVPGYVKERRRIAFEHILPEYERSIHNAVGGNAPLRVNIDPMTVPRPGNYCCLRIWARRAADGQVSATLLVDRNTIYVYGGERPQVDSTGYVRSVAPNWWVVIQ